MKKKPRGRSKRIAAAQADLESALLTLKHHFKVTWTDKSFYSLYYILRLARRSP